MIIEEKKGIVWREKSTEQIIHRKRWILTMEYIENFSKQCNLIVAIGRLCLTNSIKKSEKEKEKKIERKKKNSKEFFLSSDRHRLKWQIFYSTRRVTNQIFFANFIKKSIRNTTDDIFNLIFSNKFIENKPWKLFRLNRRIRENVLRSYA